MEAAGITSGSPINITDLGRLCLSERSEAAPPAELQGSIMTLL